MPRLLVTLLCCTLLLAACENDVGEVNDLLDNLNPEAEVAKEVVIIYSDSAVVRVRVSGPTMLNYSQLPDIRQEFPDGVLINFYDEQGAITSRLTAKQGIRREREGEVIMRDSVVWQSQAGEKLESEELIWDENRKKVYTPKFVVVTRPEEIIMGHGFEADQNFNNARIQSVEGRIAVEKPAADSPPSALQ